MSTLLGLRMARSASHAQSADARLFAQLDPDERVGRTDRPFTMEWDADAPWPNNPAPPGSAQHKIVAARRVGIMSGRKADPLRSSRHHLLS
jgi:hypothetical protein